MSDIQTRNLGGFLGSVLGYFLGGSMREEILFGYPQVVTVEMMLQGMLRMPLAETLAGMDAAALWELPPTPNSKNETFVKQWNDMAKKISLIRNLHLADKMLAIGEYSVLVVHFSDDGDLTKPLEKGAGDVIKISPYTMAMASVGKLYNDPSSPLHNTPEFYTLNPQRFALINQNSNDTRTFNVHASRVIHICEGNYVDNYYGIPRLMKLWNTLLNIAKISGSSAKAFYNVADRGLAMNVSDKFAGLTSQDKSGLDKISKDYIEGVSRNLVTHGVDVKSLGSDSPDPRGSFDSHIKLAAGIARIPQRQIVGTESGEQSSTQDRAAFARKTEGRRRSIAKDQILDPLVDMMITAGTIDVLPEDFSWHWEDAFSPSFLERAEANSKTSRALANFANANKNGTQCLTLNQFRHKFLGLGPVDGGDEIMTDIIVGDNREPAQQDGGRQNAPAEEDEPETPAESG